MSVVSSAIRSSILQDFRKLAVLQKAHELTIQVYNITHAFPSIEIYGLTSQLRRATSSVPANIAEGCGCDSNREFSRFLQIAFRSASESEYHLLLARDLGYLPAGEYENLVDKVIEVKRMLSGLIEKLKAEG